MKTVRLTEQDIQDIVNKLITEQDKIYDYGDGYDYKVVNGKWFASKEGVNKWFSMDKYPSSIKNLDRKFPEARVQDTKPSTNKNETPKKETNCPEFNINDKETGNLFRGMVNDKLPTIAKKYELDRTGSFNNSYIKKVWNVKIKFKSGKVMCIGEYFTKVLPGLQTKKENNSLVLNPFIDQNKIATDTIRVKDISSDKKVNGILNYDKEDCAQFVNDFTNSRDVIGDAWLSHDIDGAGKRVFSVYENITRNQIQKYINIYKKADGGTDITQDVKSFNEELIGGRKPSGLQLDDVVGIYYPPSENHVKAFTSAGKNYFVDGDPNKPGKTLKSGRGWSFNTHVGVVGAIKDGQPIVFHNVHGNVISEPAKNLQITWVKRV